jgi:3D (Asp-Asp-Asp) domain-containing protein
MTKQLKSVANNSMPSSDSAGAAHPLALTRIAPLHPAIELKLAPNEARLHQVKFANPELDDEHAPRIFEATAYALRGRTASGVYVRRGIVAADPGVIPLGSVVQVNAGDYSGIYTVHDTGRRIKGRIIDLWVPSRHEARKFGRQKIKLLVLRYGPRKQSNKK